MNAFPEIVPMSCPSRFGTTCQNSKWRALFPKWRAKILPSRNVATNTSTANLSVKSRERLHRNYTAVRRMCMPSQKLMEPYAREQLKETWGACVPSRRVCAAQSISCSNGINLVFMNRKVWYIIVCFGHSNRRAYQPSALLSSSPPFSVLCHINALTLSLVGMT